MGELTLSPGRNCRGPAYRWALREEATGAKEEMAEQSPEERGKAPGVAQRMPGCQAAVSSRPLPGIRLRRNAKEHGPSPSFPGQDWSEFGVLGFPLPQAQENTAPASPSSSMSGSLALQVLLPPSPTLLRSPHLPSPLPCCCTRFPLAPWHPRNSQLTRPMSLCSPAPTTLVQSFSGSLSWGPPALTFPGHWCWGPRDVSEGTARLLRGQRRLASPHTLSLGCWGGVVEEVLVGTLRSRRRAASLAVPGLRGAGVRAAAAQAQAQAQALGLGWPRGRESAPL